MYFPIPAAISIVFVGLLKRATPTNAAGRWKECHDSFEYQDDGSCWALSPRKFTWLQSRSFCDARKSQLLEIHSITEQKQAQGYLRSHYVPNTWLGGRETPDGWGWISNHSMSFTYWAPNWPSFGERDRCMESLEKNNYRWSDRRCDSGTTYTAVCTYCPPTTECQLNQVKGANGCCQCRKSGYTLLGESRVCVGQSGYNPYGQPEYIADGDPNTYLYTLPSAGPFVELDLPEPVHIAGVTFTLRQDGRAGQKFCTREHDIEVTVDTGSGMFDHQCGTYKGVKKDEPCSGRIRVVSCKPSAKVTAVRLQVSRPTIPMCSKAAVGDYCVSDEVYLGEGLNVISLTNLEVLPQS